jgi:pimeloyl-ACP methyl ester carboxylesterase
MAASVLRWEAREIRLGSGGIRYRDEGEGPVLLFVHGILASGTLWREVVPQLSADFVTKYRWTWMRTSHSAGWPGSSQI